MISSPLVRSLSEAGAGCRRPQAEPTISFAGLSVVSGMIAVSSEVSTMEQGRSLSSSKPSSPVLRFKPGSVASTVLDFVLTFYVSGSY